MPKKAKNKKTRLVSRSKAAKGTKKTIVKKAAQKKKTPKKLALKKKRTGPVSSYKGRKGEKYMSAAMKRHFNIIKIPIL